MIQFLSKLGKNIFFIFIFSLLNGTLIAGGFVELSPGYNISCGEWRRVFGNGISIGGMVGFSFSEYVNPGLGGFIVFPKTGNLAEEEYRNTYNTEYISLFTVTSYIYIGNRMQFAVSESSEFTVDFGLGIHNQRDYATIIYNNFESSDNFSGFGPFLGLGLKRRFRFSVFDYIHPFAKFYYSPGRVYYHIVEPDLSARDLYVADRRVGIIIGLSLISFGKEQ